MSLLVFPLLKQLPNFGDDTHEFFNRSPRYLRALHSEHFTDGAPKSQYPVDGFSIKIFALAFSFVCLFSRDFIFFRFFFSFSASFSQFSGEYCSHLCFDFSESASFSSSSREARRLFSCSACADFFSSLRLCQRCRIF